MKKSFYKLCFNPISIHTKLYKNSSINSSLSLNTFAMFSQGYMMKKGHRRKNWTERWFVLRPNVLSYYLSEDLLEKKGDIILNEDCFLEVGVSTP